MHRAQASSTLQRHGASTLRSTSAPSQNGRTQQNFAATQPIPIDPKQSVFLSPGELHHYYHLASLDDASTSNSSAHRTSIRDKSHARYSHWNNTLEAQRTRKKQEREKKLEKLELEQQKIDADEQAYQEAQRRIVLDRANRLLWQDTDRVKNFHGGLLLASVLKEREAQIELSHAKKAQQKLIAQTYHDIAEEDRIKALEISRMEGEKRQEVNRLAALQQLDQLKLIRARQAAERMEEVEEGERIKRMASEATKESYEEESKRQEKMLLYNREYIRANEEQQIIRQARLQKEEAEDAKIVAFANEKERLIQLRREHEQSKFQSKQERFEKMLKRQYDHLSRIKESESKRTEQQVKEIEKRTEDRIEADTKKRDELKATILRSRQAQIDRKRNETERNRRQEEILINEWKHRNQEMEQQELDDEYFAREQAKTLQQTLREQMIIKQEKLRNDINKEYEEAKMMTDARQREDAVFEAYATQQLNDLEIKGKSSIPLQLVMHNETMKQQRPGNFAMQNFR